MTSDILTRGQERTWTVGGMDCAGCAAKIRGALERKPGVADVSVSVVGESLSLKLDESATAADDVESTVRGLGYSIEPARNAEVGRDEASDGAGRDGSGRDRRWIDTGQGRLVVGTGALLATAWIVDVSTTSTVGYWGFVAACLIGLVPIASRAIAALREIAQGDVTFRENIRDTVAEYITERRDQGFM